jgi:hypothetical protein
VDENEFRDLAVDEGGEVTPPTQMPQLAATFTTQMNLSAGLEPGGCGALPTAGVGQPLTDPDRITDAVDRRHQVLDSIP